VTAQIIPFPTDRLRLTVQGYRAQPAQVVELHPRNAKFMAYQLYRQATAFDEDPQRYHEAADLYRKVIRLDPGLAIAYTNLGNVYYRQGLCQMALASYDLALKVDPRQPEAHYNIGYVLLEQGDARGAVERLKKAVDADAKFADAWFNLGTAYETLGERGLMTIAFRRYLELEHTGEFAERAMQAIRDPPPKPRRTRRRT